MSASRYLNNLDSMYAKAQSEVNSKRKRKPISEKDIARAKRFKDACGGIRLKKP